MSKMVLPTVLAMSLISLAVQANTENTNGFYVGGGASAVKLRADDDTSSSVNFKNGIVQAGYAFSEHFSIEGQYSSPLQSEAAATLDEQVDLTPYVKQDLAALGTLTNAQIADVRSVKVNVHATADLSIDTAAIFAVYRTSGDIYVKVKGGPVSINTKGKPTAKLTWDKDVATTASATITSYLQAVEPSFNQSFYDNFDESSGGEQSLRKTKFAVGVGGGYKINQHVSVELEFVKMGEDVQNTSLTANYYF